MNFLPDTPKISEARATCCVQVSNCTNHGTVSYFRTTSRSQARPSISGIITSNNDLGLPSGSLFSRVVYRLLLFERNILSSDRWCGLHMGLAVVGASEHQMVALFLVQLFRDPSGCPYDFLLSVYRSHTLANGTTGVMETPQACGASSRLTWSSTRRSSATPSRGLSRRSIKITPPTK